MTTISHLPNFGTGRIQSEALPHYGHSRSQDQGHNERSITQPDEHKPTNLDNKHNDGVNVDVRHPNL